LNYLPQHDGFGKTRIFICITLVLLFLYNPFLGMASSGAGLNIRHSASYRATVGASELQHFSPTNARKVFAIPLVALLAWFELPTKSSASYPVELSPRPQYVSQCLCADLWFRPPPL
jgi:hypothetical protein